MMMQGEDDTHKTSLLSTLHGLFSSSAPAVKRLMGCRRSEAEERWAEKAIETLVKKLRKKRGAVEALQRAVSNPDQPSECVTISRTMDGRLQVSHRKGMPHVLYCRLWRWSDLRSHHELRALECCKYPFSSSRDEVCINPYHYRRLESPVLPDVHISRQINYHQQRYSPPTHESCRMPRNVSLPLTPPTPPRPALPFDEVQPELEFQPQPQAQPQPQPQARLPSPLQPQAPSPRTQHCQVQPQSYPHSQGEVISYREIPHWATIAYYELNSRVGEVFHCTQPAVTIDGYTSPICDGERFCLGKLSNVGRNSVIENVRQHIGQGIQLHYAGGELHLECHSTSSVFLQSRICNYQHGFDWTNVVKVPHGYSVRIFDTKLFGEILSRQVNAGFAAVYELIKLCTIRLSFVKGWGADYHREDVTSTPCWIEITLNGPLRWLDNVLVSMGHPPDNITSTS